MVANLPDDSFEAAMERKVGELKDEKASGQPGGTADEEKAQAAKPDDAEIKAKAEAMQQEIAELMRADAVKAAEILAGSGAEPNAIGVEHVWEEQVHKREGLIGALFGDLTQKEYVRRVKDLWEIKRWYKVIPGEVHMNDEGPWTGGDRKKIHSICVDSSGQLWRCGTPDPHDYMRRERPLEGPASDEVLAPIEEIDVDSDIDNQPVLAAWREDLAELTARAAVKE